MTYDHVFQDKNYILCWMEHGNCTGRPKG